MSFDAAQLVLKQADGKIRTVNGIAANSGTILEVKGLDSIRKFAGPEVTVDEATRVKAEELNIKLAAQQAVKPQYTIKRVAQPPTIDGNPADWQGVPALPIAREGSPDHGQARLGYDDQNLYALFEINEATPWLNEGKDFRRLFKTGDAVDLQLDVGAKAPAGIQPTQVRLVFAQLDGKPAGVLLKPLDPDAPRDQAHTYGSPVGTRTFARVAVLAEATVAVRVEKARYCVEAAIPLAAVGLKPAAGLTIHGDLGFISSDATGKANVARTYWANKQTNLVSDLPAEAWLYPETWGALTFE